MNKKPIVIGKSVIVNPDSPYVLLKEQDGYIFRRIDNPNFGWNGHHSTIEDAIENFKNLGGNVVVKISLNLF